MIGIVAAGLAVCSVLALGGALSAGVFAPPARADHRSSGPARRPHRPIAARRLAAGVGGLGALVGWLVAGPAGLAGGGLAGAAVPLGFERRRLAARRREIEEGVIDAVEAIAAGLRSGRSLVQSLGVAAGEIGGPLGDILAEAADRASLGTALDEVLNVLAKRIGGSDAMLVAGVLGLHRRTGGAVAASLDGLVRTLRARRDGARELRSLTAQARLSAAILGLLPLGFFLFLSVVARADVESAYRTGAGASALVLGLTLQAAAFVWIRRLLRVEEA